ncbi:hypothetical protein JD844_021770, partial [Phrynosoma platyrhinos]
SDLGQWMAFELNKNFVPACEIVSGFSTAVKKGPHSNFTRFGWVAEKYAVISRITPNENCVLLLTILSDTWINSCIPETTTVASLDTSTEMNFTSTVLTQDTSAAVKTSEPAQTKSLQKLFRVICITEIITAKTTTEEAIILSPDKRTAFQNDGVQFGGKDYICFYLVPSCEFWSFEPAV